MKQNLHVRSNSLLGNWSYAWLKRLYRLWHLRLSPIRTRRDAGEMPLRLPSTPYFLAHRFTSSLRNAGLSFPLLKTLYHILDLKIYFCLNFSVCLSPSRKGLQKCTFLNPQGEIICQASPSIAAPSAPCLSEAQTLTWPNFDQTSSNSSRPAATTRTLR